MEDRKNTFIWSENWWLEGDRAWFVEGDNNILFCVNLNTGECEEAINIPDSYLDKYKLTPYCMKCGSIIYCIPGMGQYIWMYHLEDREFSRINLDKQEGVQWAVEVWNWHDTTFLVLDRLNKILEINKEECRVNSYTICSDSIVRSTVAEDSIFMLSSQSNMIYQFDCSTKNLKSYTLPDMGKRYFNICFDGAIFWLCGYEKEIYTWNQEHNCLNVLDDFPDCFEIYDNASRAENEFVHHEMPTFFYVKVIGKYIWFIPGGANKIVYADRRSGKIEIFEIDEGRKAGDSSFSWYLLEYVRDDRYMGLFSMRNDCIVEIDTKELKYQWKDYSMSNQCVQQCDKIFNGLYFEGNMLHSKLFRRKLQESDCVISTLSDGSIGSKIFKSLERKIEQ